MAAPDFRILVGYDGSEGSRDALEFARSLADSLGAGLSVATALTHEPLPLGPAYGEGRPERFEEIIALAADHLGAQPFDRHELTGRSPARELSRLARESGVDLLVVGSSHRGPLGRLYPGAVSASLLSGAPCPVAVVPRGFAATTSRPIERIGVGFDARPEAEQALLRADDLAVSLRARLELIAVVSFRPSLSDEMAHPLDVRAVERDRLTAAVAEAASASRAEVASTEVLDGDPGDLLAERSGRLDLIVVGSRGYGPVTGVLLGGVGSRLIRNAMSPVIVVPAVERDATEKRGETGAAVSS
jgi:nucleotide-binding universal stress UspA family protein